jgi:hypothetical protein
MSALDKLDSITFKQNTLLPQSPLLRPTTHSGTNTPDVSERIFESVVSAFDKATSRSSRRLGRVVMAKYFSHKRRTQGKSAL